MNAALALRLLPVLGIVGDEDDARRRRRPLLLRARPALARVPGGGPADGAVVAVVGRLAGRALDVRLRVVLVDEHEKVPPGKKD